MWLTLYCIYTFLLCLSLPVLVQCSNQSDPSSASQQIQLLLEEKQQLEAHSHQVCVQGAVVPFIIC